MTCTHGGAAMHLTIGTRCPWCLKTVTAANPEATVTAAGVTAGSVPPLEASPRREIAAPAPTTPPAPSSGRGTLSADALPGQGQHPSLPGVSDMREQSAVPPRRFSTPGSTTDTTHDAHAAQTVERVRDAHRLVVAALHDHGPMSDFALAVRLTRTLGYTVKQTSIGKRRGECVELGLVVDSGRRAKSDTGSRCIVWALTAAGEAQARSLAVVA